MRANDMEISVLGSVGVSRDGLEVALGPRVRRLLARLVIDHDHVVSSSRLIDAAWMGDPPSGAERSLKTYVSRLREAVDPEREGRLVHREPGYVLSLDGCLLDSAVFESELDEAAQALRVVDAERALASLVAAIDTWRGDPYGEFADEEWAQLEAVRLHERHVEARELLVEALLGVGDTERAVVVAKSLVGAEPLRERPRELLMRSLHASGRVPEALREFRAFRRMLVDEVGLEPSSRLVELENRIAAGEGAIGTHRPMRGYELKERIGTSAIAVVHRAIQPGVGREVAMRIIRPPLADHPAFVRQFEHQARVVTAVEHPHIVPMYDYWREPGAACLVMRLMRGGSVSDRLRAHGHLSDEATIGVVREIGPALEAAHRLGVVHGDVRPANILYDDDGVAYLSDFGVALCVPTDGGAFVAASGYAAPEMLRGEAVSAVADVYGLGVTVFELVTGRAPPDAPRHATPWIARALDHALPSVLDVRPELPASLDAVLARATAASPEERHATVVELVSEVVDALTPSDASEPPVGLPPTVIDNPYVGLHAFGESDAAHFHGRDALVADVIGRLAERPFVVLVGASGSGKSSLVRAGVLPQLRTGAVSGSERWFVTTMTPGGDPVETLEAALLRVAVNPPISLRSQLAEPGGLLRAVRRVLPDDDTTLLVVIDQFEELFTMAAQEGERERFLSELAAAIEAPLSPVRVLATLRADHYDGPLSNPAFAGLVTDGTVTVRPLVPAELEDVIIRPARAVGVDVEPSLVAEMIAGVGERPASLPLLQFALTETFRRRPTDLLALSTYRELGGLTGALAARADEIVGEVGSKRWIEARRIFGRLVLIERSGTYSRRRALVTELGAREGTIELVEQLVAARLLTVDRDDATREPTVEVAHEALLRDWPTLRRWIDEDREHLLVLHAIGERAEAWEHSDRDASELARGARLDVATELAEARSDLLNPGEMEWVEASVRQHRSEEQRRLAIAEKERQQGRRLRGLLVVACLLAAASVFAASIAIWLRGNAVDNERAAVAAGQEASASANEASEALLVAEQAQQQAEQAQRRSEESEADAEIERLVALVASQYDATPDVAMLIALEANRRRDDVATRGALQRAIATEPRLSRIIGRSGTDDALWLGAGGDVAIRASNTGELAWIDARTGRATGVTYQTGARVDDVRISDNGLVAVTDPDVMTTVLRLDGSDVTVVGTFDGFIRDFAGNTLSLEQADRSVILDVTTGDVTVELPPFGIWIELAAGGATAAVFYDGSAPSGTSEPRTDVIDVASGRVTLSFPETQRVTAVGLSAAGSLVTGYGDGEVIVRDLTAPDPGGSAVVRLAHGREVTAVGVGPDGRFSTAGGDRTIRFWSADGAQAGDRTRIGGLIGALAVTADGSTIAHQDNGGLFIYEADLRRIVDGHIDETGRGLSVDQVSPWASTLSEDGSSMIFVSLEDPAERRVLDLSGVHPNGALDFWVPSGDGGRIWTADADIDDVPDGSWAVSSVDGSEQVSWPSSNFLGPFGDLDLDLVSIAPRLDAIGERIYVLVTDEDDVWRAAWFDAGTGELLDGPADVPAGFPLVLADGRVVHSSFQAPMAVLPERLEGDPFMIDDANGLAALDRHPASGRVLAGGPDGILVVVDPTTGQVDDLVGLAGTVIEGAFSPDGTVVAALSRSEGMQLFDVETGKPIGVPMVPSGQALGGNPGIRWAADGAGVWIVPSGGPVRFVTDPARWREIACEIAGRELTAAEWRTFVSDTEPQVPACR